MDLVEILQNLVGHVPTVVQPLVVALAGAIPFVEGEGGAAIGVLGGIHPVVAAVSAVVGNFVTVAALVLLGSGARDAVVTRRARSRATVAAGGGSAGGTNAAEPRDERSAARRAKFQRAYERYGVPGVSLLGPLLLPTHFTATMLAASGVGRTRILVWQAVAIIGWTTVTTLVVSGVLQVVR
ncbi:small multidrug efflux protein [Promicromonospora sp. NPDC050880]|uniref:small multidrug efflux protein n=1 Tax=Promicromonospora sp. NPDC050880 TaxID=3364406 RepID=UPI0037A47A38